MNIYTIFMRQCSFSIVFSCNCDRVRISLQSMCHFFSPIFSLCFYFCGVSSIAFSFRLVCDTLKLSHTLRAGTALRSERVYACICLSDRNWNSDAGENGKINADANVNDVPSFRFSMHFQCNANDWTSWSDILLEFSTSWVSMWCERSLDEKWITINNRFPFFRFPTDPFNTGSVIVCQLATDYSPFCKHFAYRNIYINNDKQ